MKNTTKFTAVILSAAVLFLASCNKKKEDGTTTSSKMTTLKGNVYAPLDLSNSTQEFAPANTQITILVNQNDLVAEPDTSKKYDDYRYPATVQSDGSYSVNFPAKNNGTPFKIVMDDFATDQRQADTTTMERKIFKGITGGDYMMYSGTTQVLDLYYVAY